MVPCSFTCSAKERCVNKTLTNVWYDTTDISQKEGLQPCLKFWLWRMTGI